MDSITFTCTSCGNRHEGIPDLGFDSPYYYHQLSPSDRAHLAVLTPDTCVIAKEGFFFVRGVLRIPIIGRAEQFGWGVWVSLSQPNFMKYQATFTEPNREVQGPFFGWFNSQLPGYPPTLSLKTNVYFQPHPNRPLIELQHTDHPLSQHQHHGISVEELTALIQRQLHPQ
jgi:hypothetical protein